MTKTIAHTYGIVHEYRRQINLALLASCLIFAVLYAANLYRVISKTVALQGISRQSAALDAEIRELDSQFLALSAKISPDSIGKYGFRQAKVSAFIQRDPSANVALAGNEY